MRVIVCLVLAACVTSNATQPSVPGVASERFDDKLVDALCVRDVRCGVYVSVDRCMAARPGPSLSQRAQRETDVKAGVMSYDPVEAAACLDFIAGAACTDLAIHDDWTAVNACAPFEGGTITSPANLTTSRHYLGRTTGVEPATSRTTTWRSTS